MPILDSNLVWEVSLGEDDTSVFWTPDANEMALTVCLSNEWGERMEHDLPVEDARAMAFNILDATGGRA